MKKRGKQKAVSAFKTRQNKLTFGQDRKPLFVAGPYDNVKQILKQLDETAGPGNYDYMIPML